MFQTLLVATDFQELSQTAEDYAFQLATACGAKVVLLHAVEVIDGEDLNVSEFYTSLTARAREHLAERVSRFEQAGISCTAEVAVGKRWKVIVEHATHVNADLIVIGSHPTVHEGKPRLGTTSQQVFFASPIPLLVVRP